MIHSPPASRADSQVSAIIKQAIGLLYPELKQFANPNVVGASVRLEVCFQKGDMNHMRCDPVGPAYTLFLPLEEPEQPAFQKLLKDCCSVIEQLIVRRGDGFHGVLSVLVEFSNGVATITHSSDVVSKPIGK